MHIHFCLEPDISLQLFESVHGLLNDYCKVQIAVRRRLNLLQENCLVSYEQVFQLFCLYLILEILDDSCSVLIDCLSCVQE